MPEQLIYKLIIRGHVSMMSFKQEPYYTLYAIMSSQKCKKQC